MELNLVTWNVNGIRTRIFDNNKSTTCKLNNKSVQQDSSLFNLLQMTNADFLCFQETRCSVLNGKCLNIEDYISIFNESKEDGARSSNRYSGTAMYIKKSIKINQILFQIPNQIDGEEYIDTEGRIIIVYFGDQNENVIINCLHSKFRYKF